MEGRGCDQARPLVPFSSPAEFIGAMFSVSSATPDDRETEEMVAGQRPLDSLIRILDFDLILSTPHQIQVSG